MDKNTILDYVTETPGNTNRAVLGSMLDSIGGGSSDLPEVTADDNGKVLTVVDGVWNKALGGGENFYISFIVDESFLGGEVDLDKTFLEIQSAYESGKNLIARCTQSDTTTLAPLFGVHDIGGGDIEFEFSTMWFSFAGIGSHDILLHSFSVIVDPEGANCSFITERITPSN